MAKDKTRNQGGDQNQGPKSKNLLEEPGFLERAMIDYVAMKVGDAGSVVGKIPGVQAALEKFKNFHGEGFVAEALKHVGMPTVTALFQNPYLINEFVREFVHRKFQDKLPAAALIAINAVLISFFNELRKVYFASGTVTDKDARQVMMQMQGSTPVAAPVMNMADAFDKLDPTERTTLLGFFDRLKERQPDDYKRVQALHPTMSTPERLRTLIADIDANKNDADVEADKKGMRRVVDHLEAVNGTPAKTTIKSFFDNLITGVSRVFTAHHEATPAGHAPQESFHNKVRATRNKIIDDINNE